MAITSSHPPGHEVHRLENEVRLAVAVRGLPLKIDSVRGGTKLVEIGGTVDWESGQPKSETPAQSQPVVVEPEKTPEPK